MSVVSDDLPNVPGRLLHLQASRDANYGLGALTDAAPTVWVQRHRDHGGKTIGAACATRTHDEFGATKMMWSAPPLTVAACRRRSPAASIAYL